MYLLGVLIGLLSVFSYGDYFWFWFYETQLQTALSIEKQTHKLLTALFHQETYFSGGMTVNVKYKLISLFRPSQWCFVLFVFFFFFPLSQRGGEVRLTNLYQGCMTWLRVQALTLTYKTRASHCYVMEAKVRLRIREHLQQISCSALALVF